MVDHVLNHLAELSVEENWVLWKAAARPDAGRSDVLVATWLLQMKVTVQTPYRKISVVADKTEKFWQDMPPSPSNIVSESDAIAFPPCSSANTISHSSTTRPWRR